MVAPALQPGTPGVPSQPRLRRRLDPYLRLLDSVRMPQAGSRVGRLSAPKQSLGALAETRFDPRSELARGPPEQPFQRMAAARQWLSKAW